MEKQKVIQNLYFEEKKTLTEISKIINTSVSYISKILKKDSRYNLEKERRTLERLKKRRKKQKDMIYNSRKNTLDIEYINLKNKHDEAARELSKSSTLGNETLRKWCGSAYKYNSKKKRYEFDNENLTKPSDFPTYIRI